MGWGPTKGPAEEDRAMPLNDAPLVASLPAHDLERAKRWYEQRLGLAPVQDLGPAGQLYQTGGTAWIIYETPAAGSGKHTLGGWVVPDVEASMRELQAKGVSFEEYAMGDAGPTT